MLRARCLCGPRAHVRARPSIVADVAASHTAGRADPTGTLPIQRRWSRDLDRRWNNLKRMLPDAVRTRLDPVSHVHTSYLTGQPDPVISFQGWLDEALRQVVLGINGAWTLPYVRDASDLGALHAGRSVAATSTPASDRPTDRTHLVQALAIVELQGVIEATSQRLVRLFTNGLLTKKSPSRIAADMRSAVDGVGVQRGHALVAFMSVRAHAAATLDVLRASGVQRVGLVPETVRTSVPVVTDAFNPDQPRDKNGKWTITNSEGTEYDVSLIKQESHWFYNLHHKGKEVGAAIMASPQSSTREMAGAYVGSVEIAPKHRKKGLASALYSEIERHQNIKLKPSPGWQSPAGRALWKKRGQVTDAKSKKGMIQVLTAGDKKVCDVCEEIAQDGPYYIDEAEALVPAHPNCRCAFVPADPDEAEEFAEDSATHVAAGVMIEADDTGRVLFVRRAAKHGDHGGEWAFPGGSVEPGETVQQAAHRETREEIGYEPDYSEMHDRRITNGVDFTTYIHGVEREFRPHLNEEHDAYRWAYVNEPPGTLHPGVHATLYSDVAADEGTWDPDKHPRDKDGKFTEAGGGDVSESEKKLEESFEAGVFIQPPGSDEPGGISKFPVKGHAYEDYVGETAPKGAHVYEVPETEIDAFTAAAKKAGVDLEELGPVNEDGTHHAFYVKGQSKSLEQQVQETGSGVKVFGKKGTEEGPGAVGESGGGITGAQAKEVEKTLKETGIDVTHYTPEELGDPDGPHIFSVNWGQEAKMAEALKEMGYEYEQGEHKNVFKLKSASVQQDKPVQAPKPDVQAAPAAPPPHVLEKHLSSVQGTSAERVAMRAQMKGLKYNDPKLKELQERHNASFWKQHQQATKQGKAEVAADIASKLDKYSKTYGISNPLKQPKTVPIGTAPKSINLGGVSPPKTYVPEPQPSGPAIEFASLKKIGEQKGSNPGGVYEDAAGNRYYVKSMSKERADNEKLAAKLYALTGAPTLKYVDVKPDGDTHYVATKFEKLDKDNVSKLTPAEIQNAQQHFATHAWTANWDAAGTGGDNQGAKDGTIKTLDVGGALEFRAKGTPKGDKFGTSVGEFDTLRDGSNPDTAKLFGSMTEKQIKDSVDRVASLDNMHIIKTVQSVYGDTPKAGALASKMIARRDDLAKRTTSLSMPKSSGPDLSTMDDESVRLYYLKEQGAAHYVKAAENDMNKKIVKAGGLTVGEVAYIKAFTGAHSNVNSQMRAGVMNEEVFAFKHIMNDALDKMPKHDGSEVYRKISDKDGSVAALYEPGKIVHWQAFSSTSKNKSTWSGNVQFIIKDPKSGVDVQSISSHPGEAEVIMPADTYYRVVSRKKIGTQTEIVLTEVLPFGKKKKK